jgi:two-component sensor histidine kinase
MSDSPVKPGTLRRIGFTRGSFAKSILSDIGLAALLVAFAFGVRFSLGLFGPQVLIFAVCYPVILIATLLRGLRCGLFTLAFSILVFAWAFVEPMYSFHVGSAVDVLNICLYALAGGTVIWIAHLYQGALADSLKQRAQNELLVREQQHRSKNSLAVISSIVSQSLKHDRETQQKILGRLGALKHGEDLLIAKDMTAFPIADLVRRELEIYDVGRARLDGPQIFVTGPLGKTICMVIHELATNAVKYGAWSNAIGSIDITWRVDGARGYVCWVETGGPPPAPTPKAGFGTFLIERLLIQHDGDATVSYGAEGLMCVLSFSVSDVDTRSGTSASEAASANIAGMTSQTPS